MPQGGMRLVPDVAVAVAVPLVSPEGKLLCGLVRHVAFRFEVASGRCVGIYPLAEQLAWTPATFASELLQPWVGVAFAESQQQVVVSLLATLDDAADYSTELWERVLGLLGLSAWSFAGAGGARFEGMHPPPRERSLGLLDLSGERSLLADCAHAFKMGGRLLSHDEALESWRLGLPWSTADYLRGKADVLVEALHVACMGPRAFLGLPALPGGSMFRAPPKSEFPYHLPTGGWALALCDTSTRTRERLLCRRD